MGNRANNWEAKHLPTGKKTCIFIEEISEDNNALPMMDNILNLNALLSAFSSFTPSLYKI